LRVSAQKFFSPRSGGLVGVGDQEIILDCYRLARWYHQAPDVFLNMPLSQVQLHLIRTIELAKIMRAEAQESDDG
jgi:hypothetical protein